MIRFVRPILTLALATVLVGCNQNQTPAQPASSPAPAATAAPVGGVGTLDIMRIGRQTGIIPQIEREGGNLKQQVEAIAQQKEAEFQELRKKYGDKPTEEQKKDLEKVLVESRQAVQRVQNQADQRFREFRENRINMLNLAVKGPLDKVVKKRGLTVVLQSDLAGLYWKSDAIDITDEVLENMSGAAAASMPIAPAAQPTAPKSTTGGK